MRKVTYVLYAGSNYRAGIFMFAGMGTIRTSGLATSTLAESLTEHTEYSTSMPVELQSVL